VKVFIVLTREYRRPRIVAEKIEQRADCYLLTLRSGQVISVPRQNVIKITTEEARR